MCGRGRPLYQDIMCVAVRVRRSAQDCPLTLHGGKEAGIAVTRPDCSCPQACNQTECLHVGAPHAD